MYPVFLLKSSMGLIMDSICCCLLVLGAANACGARCRINMNRIRNGKATMAMFQKNRSRRGFFGFIDGRHSNSNAAFQLSPYNRKATILSRQTLARAVNVVQDSSDETEPNDSIRHAIENLVSIIGPSDDDINQEGSIVHIIGTGLCPTLLNLPLSTLHILSRADVVLYDSLGLSYQDITQIVPGHCEVVCVGKRGDKKSWKQSDIDELILKVATGPAVPSSEANDEQPPNKGKCIVRLKGGDPFLFGRTRTEIDALRSNSIPYSYTPGISSCIAGPHLGGIPLTDPLLNCQSFGVWSGTDAFGRSWGLKRGDDNSDDRDTKWHGLDLDVLVFLMIGRLDKLEALCHSIACGNGLHDDDENDAQKWNRETPCAVIQNAGGAKETGESAESTLPVQRVWRSTLGNIVSVIKKEDETRTSVSPAVFVVGATAALDLLSQDSNDES